MDYQTQNGRVIITDSKLKDLNMIEDENVMKNFQVEALYGIQETTTLNQAFFSRKNMDLIQDNIRYDVYMKTDKKHIIGKQSEVELEVIMRSIYLQHSPNLPNQIKEQIKYLNGLVSNWCVEKIIPELYQYLGYLKEVEYMPIPIDLPINLSSKGSRSLRSVTTTF
tara:strand:- start:740 stop:1237 length:498 start_codon:yes stop_codon:yes gene_type:complete